MTKFKHSKLIFINYVLPMKTFSIFFLMIYWSIIILAPVLSKDLKNEIIEPIIVPETKPNK